ncbi:MAG: tRNA (cytidine(34)-2'-O)-methyltransferase [Defluviicoccus sp.]
MRIALYQPDIPQNAGTIIRTAACLGLAVELIEPCGFVLSDRHFRRAGLDYLAAATIVRHSSWAAFRATHKAPARLVLLTTRADGVYTKFAYLDTDILLAGRESGGVPDDVHAEAEARVRIPLKPEARALNVAVAVAMVLGEALRQTGGATLAATERPQYSAGGADQANRGW